jgi:hypothetical protein
LAVDPGEPSSLLLAAPRSETVHLNILNPTHVEPLQIRPTRFTDDLDPLVVEIVVGCIEAYLHKLSPFNCLNRHFDILATPSFVRWL